MGSLWCIARKLCFSILSCDCGCWAIVILQSDTCSWFWNWYARWVQKFSFFISDFFSFDCYLFYVFVVGTTSMSKSNFSFHTFAPTIRAHQHHESCSLLIVIRVLKLSNSLLCFSPSVIFLPSPPSSKKWLLTFHLWIFLPFSM